MEQSNGEGDVFVLDGGRFGAEAWTGSTIYGDFFASGAWLQGRAKNYFTHLEMAAVPELITDEDGRITINYGSVQKDTSKFFLETLSITNNEVGLSYAACRDSTERSATCTHWC